MKTDPHNGAVRPLIYDYDSVPHFVRDMVSWRKQASSKFSLRRETRALRRCSATLVSHVMHGKRVLTPDRVSDFAHLLALTSTERRYLEQWVESLPGKSAKSAGGESRPIRPTRRRREGQNHLLTNWLNVYVKDAARVKGFAPDPGVIQRLLGGIASRRQIENSLRFLLREGYLQRTLDGKIVESEVLLTTSDDDDFDRKKQAFHRRALQIAREGILNQSGERRRESALVLPVSQKSLERLKALLKSFYEELLVFAENDAEADEELYQVIINLTPVGGPYHERQPGESLDP